MSRGNTVCYALICSLVAAGVIWTPPSEASDRRINVRQVPSAWNGFPKQSGGADIRDASFGPSTLDHGSASNGGFRPASPGFSFRSSPSDRIGDRKICEEKSEPRSRVRDASLIVANEPGLKETWCTWHEFVEALGVGAASSLTSAQLAACMKSRGLWP